MSSVPVGAIVLVGVIVLLIVLGVVVLVVSTAVRKRADAARDRFPNAIIVAGANFFGQESRGKSQVRGNGTLVLTETELYFEQLLPRREFHIPISRMQAVDTPRSHLGKSVGRRLLRVVFRNDSGDLDSIAWYVRDVDNLVRALESALS